MKTKTNNGFALVWKFSIVAIATTINIILAFHILWGENSFNNYREFRTNYNELEQKLSHQNSLNAELSNEIRLLKSDKAYKEKMIRNRLNYLKENEILYLFETNNNSKAGS